tara:strand:- start:41 stop:349 length:309 start_codon:yes stop_codon:yes gene_type:complete
VKLVDFCGKAYILSDWDSNDKNFQRKFWISETGTSPAAISMMIDGQFKIVLYAPDGELLEVFATTSRKEALNLIRDALFFYLDVGKVLLFSLSKEQRKWLGH